MNTSGPVMPTMRKIKKETRKAAAAPIANLRSSRRTLLGPELSILRSVAGGGGAREEGRGRECTIESEAAAAAAVAATARAREGRECTIRSAASAVATARGLTWAEDGSMCPPCFAYFKDKG